MAEKATIGNVEVTAVIDMVPPPREPSAMFPDVPADAWAAYQDTLEDGQLQLYYGVFLLKTSEHVIWWTPAWAPAHTPTAATLPATSTRNSALTWSPTWASTTPTSAPATP